MNNTENFIELTIELEKATTKEQAVACLDKIVEMCAGFPTEIKPFVIMGEQVERLAKLLEVETETYRDEVFPFEHVNFLYKNMQVMGTKIILDD